MKQEATKDFSNGFMIKHANAATCLFFPMKSENLGISKYIKKFSTSLESSRVPDTMGNTHK